MGVEALEMEQVLECRRFALVSVSIGHLQWRHRLCELRIAAAEGEVGMWTLRNHAAAFLYSDWTGE